MSKKVEIYTDGASRSNPGLSACGFISYIYEKDGSYTEVSRCEVYKVSSNNRMEVKAIILALTGEDVNNDITIYSDSAWAIGAIFKNWNITYNLDLVNRARDLVSKFKNLKIVKVKGHSDCEGNNKVDALLNHCMDNPKVILEDIYG